ncbi:tyrosine-type recombinase/integrase [Qipengyuania sp. 1NDH17]|uniref:Tyrosine-type recombinase/integrase n=1 Tax=Qipengyuania polymorpha TaxID=2867234 RepID=A0ABS7J447_9SPHN|nr:site-specific integrase [Qipengyuania polymorpha]MBX7459266.1 tyrosine-type recombinase/integrase [Qipengyuania polymorpha]
MLTDTKIAAIKPPEKGQEEHADHKVTGLRLRVGAGGAKTWTLRRRVGGKVINRKLGTYPAMRLAQARNAAEAMIEALERDGSTEGIDRPFEVAAEAWIKAKKRPALISRQLELHVYPHWRGRKLGEIKRADVRDLIAGLEGDVLPNRVLATIKTVFGYAISQDWIENSPADRIEKPNSETPRDRVLDMGEIARVWNATGLLGYPVGPWARLLLLTAQRRSEVAGMRWADLDLDNATWTLSAGDTKAKRAHLVPLAPAAVEIIKAMPEVGDYVFSTSANTPMRGFARAKSQIDQWLESKDMALAEPWRFHDLRRSAATHMVRLGIPELVVSRVLNHRVQGVTGQVYALHSYAPEKRHALEAWAAEVDRAVHGDRGGNVVSING